MLRNAPLLVLIAIAGCESPVVDCGSCHQRFILHEDLWGSFAAP